MPRGRSALGSTFDCVAMIAAWWKRGVVYQIYPRSFQDSDGDGIGDLKGITRRLDYLAWLGVDAVWLSPFYPSPMADFGYDVSDYCNVDPIFGSLEDFDALTERAHSLGLKVILDLVPNHTSDQHPWFIESRASRTSPRRGWYIWRDAAPDGGPPNNWISDFGGPAWSWDERTGQYYAHAFLPQQPDLNWRNPAVRAAIHDVMRFWLGRGADGFRIDVLWHLIKDAGFADNPENPAYAPGMGEMHKVVQMRSTDQPEIHGVISSLRSVSEEFPDRALLGEIYLPLERLVAYYGDDGRGVHLPLNFQLIEAPWTSEGIADLIRRYESALPDGAWPNWVLGNHDRPRVATRVGPAQARAAAVLLLTLRGTPTLYYGDELGLTDVAIPPELARDPRELRQPGLGLNRDPVRTPMPWTTSHAAGFTTGNPWLPVGPDGERRNVKTLRDDPASILHLYHALLSLRRARRSLSGGDIHDVRGAGGVLSFERCCSGERTKVLINLSDGPQSLGAQGNILLSSNMGVRSSDVLEAGEGVILDPAAGG
jgi:alpha-glucosidase